VTFERQFTIVLSAVGFVITLGSNTASACDASGWIPATSPTLSCLGLTAIEDGRFEVRNDCSESVEIIPEGCVESCSDAVRVDSKGTSSLSLPAAARDGDRKMFVYKKSEQTGSIAFTYEYNDCSSDDDGEGCSAASTGGPASVFEFGALFAFAFLGRGRRYRRPGERN
jgi:hypothetical protein